MTRDQNIANRYSSCKSIELKFHAILCLHLLSISYHNSKFHISTDKTEPQMHVDLTSFN